MNRLVNVCLILATLAIAVPVSAQDCEPTTFDPEVAVAGYYIDNDPCQPECFYSTWVYFESNDMAGLQRVDEVKDDTCHGQIEGDVIVF